MKKLGITLGLVLLVFFAVLVVRTLGYSSRQIVGAEPVVLNIDGAAAAERFAGGVRFPTISNQDPAQLDTVAFRGLHEYVTATYPRTHETLSREIVGGFSLLYTWRGRDPALEPVVLMGHMDVVPVIPGTESGWTHPPFGGVVADGFIWGRGSTDDKSSVFAILEAVEWLLGQGFQPARTIYLAFGHDEEVGGVRGAREIARLLEQRVPGDLAFVLDEGGAVTNGLVTGFDVPVAIVGVAEKGSVSLTLMVQAAGGHSSTPPRQTAIGILSGAITKLEANPFPLALDGAALNMFDYLGPEMPFTARLALANRWLFNPLIKRNIAKTPSGASMLRTTTAATIFNAGVKSNVLPISATALVNFRIRPGETVETVTERARRVIDDERVQITPGGGRNPSPVSDIESAPFRLITKTIRQAIPDPGLLVAPYLVPGGTDARYYSDRSRNVYRFLPARANPETMLRVHGTNERFSVDGFLESIKFFALLIQNTDEL